MRETSELPTASLRAPIVTRHSRTHARHSRTHARHSHPVYVIPAKAGIHPAASTLPKRRLSSRRRRKSTQCDRAQRSTTKTRARAHAREATAFRFPSLGTGCTRVAADWTLRYSPPVYVIPAKAGISRCARVTAEQTHRSELPPSRHAKRSNRTPKGCANDQGELQTARGSSRVRRRRMRAHGIESKLLATRDESCTRYDILFRL